ncbi:MAG: cyclic nucleotide-binding domain-containing protein [Myxococcales bacterium]|nr:MAG: cyclic nucleotide-binding domain-containing protein [Myxococcales bacterium]
MTEDLRERHRDFLRTFAVFKDFHPNELLLLASHLTERRYERDQVIFSEGDPGKSLYFIVFGAAAILKNVPGDKYEPLATLKSGQMFGQVSLIDGQDRSASAVAAARTLLLELDKPNFDRMFELRETFAFRFQDYLTRMMVRQVREANDKLASLVFAARKKKAPTRVEMTALAEQMKDAMRSAREMGVDLDEVEYEIAEGQARVWGEAHRQHLAEKTQIQAQTAEPSNRRAHPPRETRPDTTYSVSHVVERVGSPTVDLPSLTEAPPQERLAERERATREIERLSRAKAPGQHESRIILLDSIDLAEDKK